MYRFNECSEIEIQLKKKEFKKMENAFRSQCNELLNRIKSSNIKPYAAISHIKQQNSNRLQSLSITKRKLKHCMMHRQFSLAGGMQGFNSQSQQQQYPRLGKGQSQQYDSDLQNTTNQPQFNLRKGTKTTSLNFNCSLSRKPFTNLGNFNKIKLILTKDKTQIKSQFIRQHQNTIQKTLRINSLVGKYETRDPTTVQLETINSTECLSLQNDKALKNANIVNEIFNYIKEKSNAQTQQIGQFTEIVFKLICYFFVSFTNEQPSQCLFDQSKMTEFVQKQIAQSYNVLSSFKKQRRSNLHFSKKNISQIEGHLGSDETPIIVRKQKRVSSFFKAIQSKQKYDEDKITLDHKSLSTNTKQLQKRRISIAFNPIKEEYKENSLISKSSNFTQKQDSISKLNSNELLPKMNFREPNTRRKSCFMTQKIKTQSKERNSSFNIRENESNQCQIPSNHLNASKKSSRSNLKHEKLRESVRLGSVLGFSQLKQQSMDSFTQINSKQPLSSKISLDLSTPYDFLKQDNLITKRRKYLQLHQKIIQMNDNLVDMRKQEQQIGEKIEQRDNDLIQIQNRLIELNKEKEQLEARNKEAEQFLNGSQCPQMVQKIIKKKTEIKKNLTSLINSHAWYSSNLAQASHIQHIMTTKQTSLDKLNIMTRKFRGCKNLEDIESLVGEMREIFLITVEKYGEIIDELQDKITQAEQSRSNMLKNLEDWEIETKIKEKLVSNSFMDYYSLQRRVSMYVENLPESFHRLQQYVYILSQQRKSDHPTLESSTSVSPKIEGSQLTIQSKVNSNFNLKKVMNLQKQMFGFLQKMILENQKMGQDLIKQKKFAMVLQKIV